jgi:hypothetical protein
MQHTLLQSGPECMIQIHFLWMIEASCHIISRPYFRHKPFQPGSNELPCNQEVVWGEAGICIGEGKSGVQSETILRNNTQPGGAFHAQPGFRCPWFVCITSHRTNIITKSVDMCISTLFVLVLVLWYNILPVVFIMQIRRFFLCRSTPATYWVVR